MVLATAPAVPDDCQVLIAANPRTTFLPAESAALRRISGAAARCSRCSTSASCPEPGLAALLEQLGVRLPQEAVVDPLSHYARDREMVAVTGYGEEAITRGLSMTFFAGVRPLVPVPPAAGLVATPLFASSRDSYTRAVRPAHVREAAAAPRPGRAGPPQPAPRLLAMSVEGRLPGAAPDTPPMRAVIVGDADFASNSFLPYLANGDLALAAVRWLAREERSTAVASRIPVPPMILLTGAQMRGDLPRRRGAAPARRVRARRGRMVARPVNRALPGLAAVAAIGYLVAMVVTGALPQSRQRVQFEAKGVMQLRPSASGGWSSPAERTAPCWCAAPARRGRGKAGVRSPRRSPRQLSIAVQYMHTAAPVRVLDAGGARRRRSTRVRARPPALSIALHAESGPVIRARFGGRNPDDMLQYMAIEGRRGDRADVALRRRGVACGRRRRASGAMSRVCERRARRRSARRLDSGRRARRRDHRFRTHRRQRRRGPLQPDAGGRVAARAAAGRPDGRGVACPRGSREGPADERRRRMRADGGAARPARGLVARRHRRRRLRLPRRACAR